MLEQLKLKIDINKNATEVEVISLLTPQDSILSMLGNGERKHGEKYAGVTFN